LKSEHDPIPDELARELAALVIEWSGFEAAIDLDSGTMKRQPAVAKLFEDEPRTFKRKVAVWAKAVRALHPDDEGYKEVARFISSEGKYVARHRHAIIHGHWMPPDPSGGPWRLRLVKPLEKLPAGYVMLNGVDFVGAVHERLREMTDTLWAFTLNRIVHGHLGRSSAPREPKP